MRPDSAVRLISQATNAVGRAIRPHDTMSIALQDVAAGIEAATRRVGRSVPPRIVAVTKGRSTSLVREAYNYGIHHFGENYINELQGKARELKSLIDIKWHFIGRLQTKQIKKLVEVPGLWMVETVSSFRAAKTLNQRWGDVKEQQCISENNNLLQIMLQVNTSGEESKQGCIPEECIDLGQYVVEDCPHLKLCGLMTIGRQGQMKHPNPDFMNLVMCHELLSQHVNYHSLELSMGMSEDYEQATELGSTNVRIGRAIFNSSSV